MNHSKQRRKAEREAKFGVVQRNPTPQGPAPSTAPAAQPERTTRGRAWDSEQKPAAEREPPAADDRAR